MIQHTVLPALNAAACLLSVAYIIRAGKYLGYWPVMYCVLFVPLLWVGMVYSVFLFSDMSLETLSLLIRGPLLLVLLSPFTDAYTRLREANLWHQ